MTTIDPRLLRDAAERFAAGLAAAGHRVWKRGRAEPGARLAAMLRAAGDGD